MTPEQRRQAVAKCLEDNPKMSQRAIAKAIGASQASVARTMAAMRESNVIQLGSLGIGAPPQVTRGDALVARLRGEMAEQGLIPTSVEEAHLATAKDLADRIERLQSMVRWDGESRKLKDGRVVLHPALAEIRQCESVLTRVVSAIPTMEAPAKDPKKQKAANTRWRANRLAAVQRDRQTADPYSS